MTQIKTKIPAELEPAAVGGMVTDSKYVKDRVKNKTQEEVNADTEERVSTLEGSVGTGGSVDERIAVEKNRAEQAEGVLDGKVATEKQRAEGVEGGLNTRLQTVEQLAEISVGGGDIGIGTAADFESDDPEDWAKVPTVGAMLGGANDGVYDISARHSGTKYADLAAALGENGANIPQSLQKGGMSVKFVQSSDNKYVQARLMADSFTTDVTQWQGVDDEPTVGSENLVKSGGVYDINEKIFIDNNTKGCRFNLYGNNNYNINQTGDVGKVYGVKSGHIYRVCIINTNIDMSGVTVQNTSRFAIYAKTTQNIILKDILIGSSLNSYYDFICPENATEIWLSCRCTKGTMLNCYIFDLTEDVLNENNIYFDNNTIGHRAVLIGKGDDAVNSNGDVGKMFGIESGHKYRVCIINPDVDMSNITSIGHPRFTINTEGVTLLSVIIGTQLNSYYDVTIPAGKTSLWLSCRCAIGAKFNCYVYDLTRYENSVVAENKNILFSNWIASYFIPTLNVGDTLNLNNLIPNPMFECAVVDCVEGDEFLVNNYNSGGSAKAICFIDAENKVLEQSGGGEILNTTFIAPQNTAKVVFNNRKNDNTGDYLNYFIVIKNQIPDDYLKFYAKKEELEDYATKQYVDDALGIGNKTVDLIIFAGQSNMAGRGETNAEHPESYPTIIEGAGYEYRAISDPTKLHPIIEPFGVGENNPNGIAENSKTGSLVTSFVNAYFTETHRTVIGVSAAQGGTAIGQWQPNGTLLPDALQRFSDAITFLTNNGYTIKHKYVAWLQGETDGDYSTAKDTYKTLLNTMFNSFKNAGAEKLLLIRIGKRSYDEAYENIIDAQTELCKSSDDIIMISTALSDFRRRGFMKDFYHYYQDGYNLIGMYAGHNAGIYSKYGIERVQYDSEDKNLLYNSYKCD